MVIGYVWLVGYTLDTAVTWLQLSQDTLKMDATEATTQVYGTSYISRDLSLTIGYAPRAHVGDRFEL